MTGGFDPAMGARVNPGILMGGQNQLNPFEAMQSIATTAKTWNDIRNQNARFAAQQLGGEIMAQYPGDPISGAKALAANPVTAGFAADIAETYARTGLNITQNAGAEQDQTQNALHGLVQGMLAAKRQAEAGDLNGVETVWNQQLQRTLATVNPALRGRVQEGAVAVHDSLLNGTQGVTGPALGNILTGNMTNLMASGGLGGDQMQFVTGQLVTRQRGNVIETFRVPPDGSPLQLISTQPMGLGPQLVEGPGGPMAVGPFAPGPQIPTNVPVYPGATPDQPTVLGRGIDTPPGEALGGAGQGQVPFAPRTVGPSGEVAPTTPAGGAPTSGPSAPPPVGPTPTAPTAPGAPPSVTPEAARPYTVGGGGQVPPLGQLPPEGKQMNYATPLIRANTVVPDGRAANAPVFGDGTLGWNSPQDLVSTQRAYGAGQQKAEDALQEQYTADNAAGGRVAQAQQIMSLSDIIKNDLRTITEDPKASKIFVQLGPKLGDRMNIAQWDQLLSAALDKEPTISNASRTALESYVKATQNLVIQSAKYNLGQSHVAAESINRVAQTQPGLENSPLGAMLLTDINKAQVQQFLDQNAFRTAWRGVNYNRMLGADPAFNNNHSMDRYTNEVYRQYNMLPTGQFRQDQASFDNVRRMAHGGLISGDNLPSVLNQNFPNWQHQYGE